MKKSIFLLAGVVLFFSACAEKTVMEQINQISKVQPCAQCENKEGFEAKIKGLFYISDIGIQCCADRRTLDTSVALKKVYLHRIYDLPEEKKTFYTSSSKYLVKENFNAIFYSYVKQELEARGMIVIEDINNSPYVLKLDLSFIDFNSKLDDMGLNSKLTARLELKDININKTFVVNTNQRVVGFKDLNDISFYTYLLIKQMANKTASIISSL